jgi:3-hydroxyisobutyrate dehydrogenase-like beta-hydroxyacid dehydrogenase
VESDLTKMAARVEYFGERPDLAAVFKLCGNALIVGINALVADVLAVAAESRVASTDALRVVEFFSPSAVIAGRGKKMVSGDYTPSFRLGMARKDVRLMLETAGTLPLAVLPRIAERIDVLLAQGHAKDDLAAIGKDSVRRQATEPR